MKRILGGAIPHQFGVERYRILQRLRRLLRQHDFRVGYYPGEARSMNMSARATLAFLLGFTLMLPWSCARAHDDGRFEGSPLKSWFDKLASGKGLCCSFADGYSVADVDWDTEGGHYRVRLMNKWIDVPDIAIVGEPNKFGPAVVWPFQDMEGVTQIRCFLPGSGA